MLGNTGAEEVLEALAAPDSRFVFEALEPPADGEVSEQLELPGRMASGLAPIGPGASIWTGRCRRSRAGRRVVPGRVSRRARCRQGRGLRWRSGSRGRLR
jgi:hypothetical protein